VDDDGDSDGENDGDRSSCGGCLKNSSCPPLVFVVVAALFLTVCAVAFVAVIFPTVLPLPPLLCETEAATSAALRGDVEVPSVDSPPTAAEFNDGGTFKVVLNGSLRNNSMRRASVFFLTNFKRISSDERSVHDKVEVEVEVVIARGNDASRPTRINSKRKKVIGLLAGS
jgi:hypothetical protein